MAKAYTVYQQSTGKILYSVISATQPILATGEAIEEGVYVDDPGHYIENHTVLDQKAVFGLSVAVTGKRLDFTGLPAPCRVLVSGPADDPIGELDQVTTVTWSKTLTGHGGVYAITITPDDPKLAKTEQYIDVV